MTVPVDPAPETSATIVAPPPIETTPTISTPVVHAPVVTAAKHVKVVAHHGAKLHRALPALTLSNAAIRKLVTKPVLQLSAAPIKPREDTFVPPQGVTLVPPASVQVATDVDMHAVRTFTPPKAPTLPSSPNSPLNDSPASFGGALSGPAGAAILLFAALAAVLLIMPPWVTSRVAMAVAVPIEWHRRLSLERPG